MYEYWRGAGEHIVRVGGGDGQVVHRRGAVVVRDDGADGACGGPVRAAATSPSPGGYFLGPSADGKKTLFGPPLAWTTTMLNTVASTGQVWRVVPADREQLLHDLRYWKASVLVLAPDQHNAAALRATVEEFLGPARPVSDVLIWDVRELT
jgi:hypothetical protein